MYFHHVRVCMCVTLHTHPLLFIQDLPNPLSFFHPVLLSQNSPSCFKYIKILLWQNLMSHYCFKCTQLYDLVFRCHEGIQSVFVMQMTYVPPASSVLKLMCHEIIQLHAHTFKLSFPQRAGELRTKGDCVVFILLPFSIPGVVMGSFCDKVISQLKIEVLDSFG